MTAKSDTVSLKEFMEDKFGDLKTDMSEIKDNMKYMNNKISEHESFIQQFKGGWISISIISAVVLSIVGLGISIYT